MSKKLTKIIRYPDPILGKKCKPIDSVCHNHTYLAEKMLKIMHDNQGYGLSGPQIGLSIRIFVCNHTGEPKDDQVWINPTLSGLQGTSVDVEGCLSLPGVKVRKNRATSLIVGGLSQSGQWRSLKSEGLFARIIQHEMDHLNGVLIIDHMSPIDQLINRRVLKALESNLNEKKKLN